MPNFILHSSKSESCRLVFCHRLITVEQAAHRILEYDSENTTPATNPQRNLSTRSHLSLKAHHPRKFLSKKLPSQRNERTVKGKRLYQRRQGTMGINIFRLGVVKRNLHVASSALLAAKRRNVSSENSAVNSLVLNNEQGY